MQEYINSNLNIPKSAQEFSGKLIVQFIISKEGLVSDIEVKAKTEIPTKLKEEIERVFINMPKWTPAICGDKNSNSKQNYPLIIAVGE